MSHWGHWTWTCSWVLLTRLWSSVAICNLVLRSSQTPANSWMLCAAINLTRGQHILRGHGQQDQHLQFLLMKLKPWFMKSWMDCHSMQTVAWILFGSLGSWLLWARHGIYSTWNCCNSMTRSSGSSSTVFPIIGWRLLVVQPPGWLQKHRPSCSSKEGAVVKWLVVVSSAMPFRTTLLPTCQIRFGCLICLQMFVGAMLGFS